MNHEELADRLERIPVPDAEEARERTVAAALGLDASQGRSARRFRGRRSLRIAVLAVVGACALLVAGAIVRGSDGSTEADSFGSFAALAAEQTQDQIQHVAWESKLLYDRPEHWAQGARYPDQVEDTTEVRLWIDDDGRYECDVHRFWDGDDKVTRSEYLFDGPGDMLCFTGFGEKGPTCSSLSSMFGTPSPLDGPDLPSDPMELRAALVEEIRSNYSGMYGEPSSDGCSSGSSFGMPVPLPLSVVGGTDRQTLMTDLRAAAGLDENRSGWTYRPPMTEKLFMLATGLLANPRSEPELRAGLFQVLAELEGAQLAPEATDQLGREASVIEYVAPPADPDLGRVARDQLFVDPKTSEVLEQRTTVEEPEEGSDETRILGTYYRFTERSDVESLPAQADGLETAAAEAVRRCARAQAAG